MASFEQIIKFENEKPHGVVRLVEANGSLGVLSHYDSYFVREVMNYKSGLSEFGRFSDDGLRFYPDALSWRLFRFR